MEAIVKKRCRVLPGNRMEITSPELVVGEEVEVTVTACSRTPERPTRSIFEILEANPRPGTFKSPEDVDRFLEEERNSWDD